MNSVKNDYVASIFKTEEVLLSSLLFDFPISLFGETNVNNTITFC